MEHYAFEFTKHEPVKDLICLDTSDGEIWLGMWTENVPYTDDENEEYLEEIVYITGMVKGQTKEDMSNVSIAADGSESGQILLDNSIPIYSARTKVLYKNKVVYTILLRSKIEIVKGDHGC
jgi:hypothetical protein